MWQVTAEDGAAAVDEESGPESKKAKTAACSDDEEPNFELSEEFRMYRGDPTDRKAMIAFRQKQQVQQVMILNFFPFFWHHHQLISECAVQLGPKCCSNTV